MKLFILVLSLNYAPLDNDNLIQKQDVYIPVTSLTECNRQGKEWVIGKLKQYKKATYSCYQYLDKKYTIISL